MSPGKAVYLFCFARSDLLRSQLEIEGLEPGSRLLQHGRGDLVAVLSEVSLEDFTGPRAEAQLQDLGWLAPRALRHEQVIEETARHSPVFPARFGTIFSSLELVEAQLLRHHDAIRAFLDRTLDTEEWGVKGYLDRNQAQERLVEEELSKGGAAALSASPGMRYMQERKLRAQVSGWLGETSTRLKDVLARRALELAERRLLPAGAGESPGEMVLNWSFLVPRPGVKAFLAEVEQQGGELAERGLVLQTAGPFPPFSFTPGLDEPRP